MAISERERQRRSEQARRQHATGSLGRRSVARRAAEASAAVRSRRSSELAQRLVEEHQDRIEAVLLDALKRGTRGQRLRAVEMLFKVGLRAEALDATVSRDTAAERSREELLELLADKLTSGPAAAIVRQRIESGPPVVDAEVVAES